jgi:CubicO group peptidase (beta-lactamase class C family)
MELPQLGILLLPALLLPLEAAQPQPRNIEELKTEIQKVLVSHGVPGAGIVMVSPDRVLWAGGIGKADIAAGKDVTPETLFRIGSISKSFVALALMKLQEEGKINLEAKVKDLAPEIDIPNPWEATHPVRVVHLLEHTAGFDDWRWAGNLTGDPAEIPLRGVMERFPGRQRVRWLPGTRMVYSNHGYVVAGYLIEKITGQRFDEYIRSAVLEPLGMRRSGFGRTDANCPLLAQGYSYRPPRLVPYQFLLQRPAGDMVSSPADMAPFLQMWLNRGRVGGGQLVRPGSIARMEEARTSLAARMGLKGGYGLANHSLGGPVVQRRGHGGQLDGFMSFYAYMPEARLAYAVFVNTSMWGPGLAFVDRLVYEYLTTGMRAPEPPPPVSATEAALRGFEGVYLPADFRVHIRTMPQLLQRTCRMTSAGGGLRQSSLFGRGGEQLLPVSPAVFRGKDESEGSVAFARAEDGNFVMTGSRGYFERVPAWKPYVTAGGLLLAFLLMLSAIGYALVWIPAKLFGRSVKHIAVRAVPLAAVLTLLAVLILMARSADDLAMAGRPDIGTIGYRALTLLFPVLSLWGLLLARRSFAYELKPAVRIHALLVSVACCGVAVALAHWGLIGIGRWT